MSFSKRLLSGAPPPFVNNKNFRAVLYTGNGGTQSITGVGFKPDFVWLKNRSQNNYAPRIFDSSRGATKRLQSSTNAAESTDSTSITSFDADGFTLGADNYVNNNGDNFVAWCWKAGGGTTSSNSDGDITSTVQANTDAGFSIVKYTGNNTGSNQTIAHGLGATPEIVILKALDRSADWAVIAPNAGVGPGDFLQLNGLSAASGSGTIFGYASNTGVSPTSTVFTVGGSNDSNATGEDYVAYCFKSVSGFSKIGTYTGNSSNDGPIVETGFEPAFLMIKNIDDSGSWFIYDNKRNTSNPRINYLHANGNNVEASDMGGVDFLSNGFQIKEDHDDVNDTGDTYIYMAFAANPDEEAPTLPSSFNIETYVGNASNNSVNIDFDAGLTWIKNRDSTGYNILFDTIRGLNQVIHSGRTNAQQASSNNFSYSNGVLSFDGSTTWGNKDGDDYIAWAWQADDNEPTIIPEAGKKIYLNHGASNYVAINAVSGSTGKYYFEVKFLSYTSANTLMVGLYTNGYADGWQNTRSRSYYANSGKKYKGSTASNYGATFTTGDTIGVAVNGDDDEITFYKNGTSQGLAFSGNEGDSSFGIQLSTGLYPCTAKIRFTSDEWQYSAPSGFTEWTAAKTAYDNNDITSSGGGFSYDNIESIVSVNSNAGFSIVKFTGDGSVQPVPHGLSSAPEMILFKNLDSTGDWQVYHTSTGNGNKLVLNDNAAASSTTRFDSTSPTASVFTFNSSSYTGGIIAYCFHSVSGFSKFGTYTGSTSGVTITTGFKPDFILIKCTSNVEYWAILDTRRGTEKVLNPDRDAVEGDSTLNTFTVSSTGFSFPHQDTADAMLNENGYEYIYWAVAKNVPSNTTLANSFKTVTYTGTGNDGLAVTGIGFRPDMVWIKNRDLVRDHNLADSVQGPNKEITPNLTEAVENRSITSFDSDGFTLDNASGNYNDNGSSHVAWCWKAGNTWQSNVDGGIPSTVNVNTANGFSIVKWEGTGSATTVGHGLGAAPEMIIVKNLSNSHSGNAHWAVYHTGVGETKVIYLNRDNAEGTSSAFWNDTAPTSSVFSIGTDNDVNVDGEEFIAYCWDSVSGFSSIGTYTGNGSTTGPTVTTGFQPDFLLVKDKTNASTNWRIVDSVRGTDATDGSGLFPNLNIAEQTDGTQHAVEFQSNGFQIRNATSGWNNNSATHIYMAFKMN
tara:strand:+ start:930 stop:4478 length:3549 start_codon:yes stop_codon:yes gene_type:complete